jgi:PLP dependent protein
VAPKRAQVCAGIEVQTIIVSIANKLQHVQQRIEAALVAAQRPAGSVKLLAVSKTFGADAVRQAHAAGQRDFGENYVQEALAKIHELEGLCRGAQTLQSMASVPPTPHGGPLQWHLIGPLQSNKTRAVAEAFDWVHTVDRLKIAERLAEQRPVHLKPLQICLQVNVSGQASKSGVPPEELPALAAAVAQLAARAPQRLCLRGLMAIPEPVPAAAGLAAQTVPHARLSQLLAQLQDQFQGQGQGQGVVLDVLSTGMSADLEAAVHAGANWVRVGTAIFGGRGASASP